MRRIFIATYRGQWAVITKLLLQNLNFTIINLGFEPYKGIPNKKTILKREILYILQVFRKFSEINHSEIIITPSYLALFLLLLKKINLLKVANICWFGMFIHSSKAINLIGKIIKRLYPADCGFFIIVFSKEEIRLYSEKWGTSENMFIYCPYGDWNIKEIKHEEIKDEHFFFSGGYSNRDYVGLVRIFERIPEKLVIVASSRNNDLLDYQKKNKISDNIQIFYDLSQEDFDNLLLRCSAVIFHMKDNTGASGQMVALNAMRNRKLIISSQNDSIKQYVQDGLSAIFYDKDNSDIELRQIIKSISEDNSDKWRQVLTNEAYKVYESKFTCDHLQTELITSISKLL